MKIVTVMTPIVLACANVNFAMAGDLNIVEKNANIENCYKQTLKAEIGRVASCTALIRANNVSKKNKAIALHNRAVIWLQKGQREKALKDFMRAVERNPNALPSLLAVAQLHYQKQDFQLAQEYFEKAKALDALHPLVMRFTEKQSS